MEIEIRAQINNSQDIEKKIIELGAKLLGKKKQIDEYFGEINLYKKLGYSFLMRVRTEGDQKFITYKGAQLKKDGVWEEYELAIDNSEKAIKMFQAMGLERVIVVHKYRKEYRLNDLTICLDHLESLGEFIEIESLQKKDINKNVLKDFLQKLNIPEDQIIHQGYVTMLLAKNKTVFSKYIIN